jgi:ABC-type transport system substrate-binding protein
MMRRFVTVLVFFSLLASVNYSLSSISADPGNDEIILKAAVQEEIRSKNILNDNNLRRSNSLWLCYDTVLKIDPETGEPLPYILRGTETNGLTGLQTSEIGRFDFMPGSPDNITAYYDFTYLYFHDGEQVDVMDIIFSYHLVALHPTWYPPILPLMDGGNLSGNFSFFRWLWISPVDDGDSNPHTAALRFRLTTPYYAIWEETLNIHIFPQHVWEGTGKRKLLDGSWVAPLHSDFGYAIDSEGRGIPVSHPTLNEFSLTGQAIDWEPNDDDVIGTGMFEFNEVIPNSSYKLKTNGHYLTANIGEVSIHTPYIDGVEFIKFSTPQQATMGIKKGEVDIILWSVPPDFIYDLRSDPSISISYIHGPELAFFAFNMRSSMFGYPEGNPSQGDAGKPLREAIAYLIDRKTLTDVFMQGLGIMADGPVSPLNSFWYNVSLPNYDFNVNQAELILNANGYNDSDGNGWRDLEPLTPGEQDQLIEILAPTADYDPIRAQPCILLETHMREAGINAKCNHQAGSTIMGDIEDKKFTAFLFSGFFAGHNQDPTRNLHELFFCGNQNESRNIFGYCSPVFDQIITSAMKELDRNTRQMLVKRAQGIVVEDLPIRTMSFKDQIIAHSYDRFTGWINHEDSLFNYWSLMNIRQASEKRLGITLTVASAVSSNKTELITIRVRDQDNKPVEDAVVYLKVKLGNLSYGGFDHGDEWRGTTDIGGQVLVNFIAPYTLDLNGTRVFITAFAKKDSYDDSKTKNSLISIFPEGVSFLSVSMIMSISDWIYEKMTGRIEVIVKDEKQLFVDNATVHLTSVPSDLEIDPDSGTTSPDGRLSNVELRATDVDKDTIYTIIATPSKTGKKGVEGALELTVLYLEEPPPPPTPTLEIVLIVVLLLTAVIIYVILVKKKIKRI